MARLTFPDEGSRSSFRTAPNGRPLTSAAGAAALVYLDAGATTLADIQTTAGVAIAGSSLNLDAYSRFPLFLGPADGTDTLYVVVDGGPVSPMYARVDDRIDAVKATADAAETPAGAAAKVSAEAATRAAADSAEATARAAAVTAAQAAAVQRSNHTGTQLAATISDLPAAALAATAGAYQSITTALTQHDADAENAAALARIRALFAPARAGVWAMLGLDGTTYSLVQGIATGNRYWRVDLRQETTNPGNYALNQLDSSLLALALVGVGTMTRTGTFVTNTNSAAFGGNYYYTITAGDTVSHTTAAAQTMVGVRTCYASNGGVWKVSIDTDATLANLLPTAQNLVDIGALASTVLVANGGTLNPTDRVLDCYNGTLTLDVGVAIADNLAPAAHTVLLTCTGYRNTLAATGRCYVTGFGEGTAATTPSTSGAWLFASQWINTFVGSAWEDAIQALPAGATTTTFIGNVHGYEVQDTFAGKVDFISVTYTAGQIRAATAQASFTRTSHLLHPDTGTTVWATKTVNYTMSPTGLAVTPTVTTSVDTTAAAWWAMCPSNGPKSFQGMDRGALIACASAFTFNAAGDVYNGSSKSAAAWTWSSTGKAATLMWMADIYGFTNNWANSVNFSRIEDRGSVNPKTTKIYLPYVDQSAAALAVPAGTVKSWTARYQAAYFPSGAEASLAAA